MELVIRATIVYWFLWLVVRGIGKRSLSELTPLDLLMIVVLGDFVQQGVTQEDMSATGAVIAVSVFVFWTVIAAVASRRWPKVGIVLASEPAIVLRDGAPLTDRLKRERLTVDELREAAREHGYADLDEIEVGVLETDGKFSFVGRAGRERPGR